VLTLEHPIIREIDAINWSDIIITHSESYENYRYVNAEEIAAHLKDLFSGDMGLAMKATNDLWGSLCPQHSYLSSVALTAYDFLMAGLKEFDDKLKVELLDIFYGFAICTCEEKEIDPQKLREWRELDAQSKANMEKLFPNATISFDNFSFLPSDEYLDQLKEKYASKKEFLDWEIAIRKKLMNDIQLFKELSLSDNESISYFAGQVVACLSTEGDRSL